MELHPGPVSGELVQGHARSSQITMVWSSSAVSVDSARCRARPARPRPRCAPAAAARARMLPRARCPPIHWRKGVRGTRRRAQVALDLAVPAASREGSVSADQTSSTSVSKRSSMARRPFPRLIPSCPGCGRFHVRCSSSRAPSLRAGSSALVRDSAGGRNIASVGIAIGDIPQHSPRRACCRPETSPMLEERAASPRLSPRRPESLSCSRCSCRSRGTCSTSRS